MIWLIANGVRDGSMGLLILYSSPMLSKILNGFRDPKELAMAASGLLLLGYYLCVARKDILQQNSKPRNQHKLELQLRDLLDEQAPSNITKIVLTEVPNIPRELEFFSEITSTLKSVMLKKGLTTLINCSPLKILNSGCGCLLESLSNVDADDQAELMSYYENALRCQMVIEKTIVDIESIKKEKKPVYLLCDNNNMDIKVNADQAVWQEFLHTMNITEEQLLAKYQVVFHVRFPEGEDEEENQGNCRIKEVWRDFNNYNEIMYNPDLPLDRNVQLAVDQIMQTLEPFIPVAVPNNSQ